MTPDSRDPVGDLFGQALDLPREERGAFLDVACGDDAAARAELDSLLAAHDEAKGFLRTSGSARAAAHRLLSQESVPDPDRDDAIGIEVGPYRIVRRVGAGGMGSVYLAERSDRVFEKQVAVKLIKRGMDTDDILRRFHTERQVLAGLEHPNIARLIDGGATDDGRPYLVMEFVDGLPVDQYCDENRLSVRDRVSVFHLICAAVRSAHQSGVVHRDLKPSNVLVTSEGTPKLLDFGIAKVLTAGIDRTIDRTATRERLLSPRYASPEQIRGEPVTPASDVYSLGVVLYELLTGISPYPTEERASGTLEEWICEHQPEKPSRAVRRETGRTGGSADESSKRLSETRSTTFRRLKSQLAGDLDIVVLKAIRKQPGDRYASAEELGQDLSRYLAGLPILARPESWYQRPWRFVRRNWVAVTAGVLVFVALIAASVVSTGLLVVAALVATVFYFQSIRARNAAQDAQGEAEAQGRAAREISRFLQEMLGKIDPEIASGKDVTLLRELLDDAAKRIDTELAAQPEAAASLHHTVGHAYWAIGRYIEAKEHTQKAAAVRRSLYADDHPLVADSINVQARCAMDLGDHEEAEALYREAVAIRTKEFGEVHATVVEARNGLGLILEVLGRNDEAEECYRHTLALARQLESPKPVDLATPLSNLGRFLNVNRRGEGAEPLLREAVEVWRNSEDDDFVSLGMVLHNLACFHRDKGDLETAEPLFHEALAAHERVLDPGHPTLAVTYNGLADLFLAQGELAAAEPLYRRAAESQREAFGAENRAYAVIRSNLGHLLERMDRSEEAEPVLLESLQIQERLMGKDHFSVGVIAGNLAETLASLGRWEEARELAVGSRRIYHSSAPDESWRSAKIDTVLGAALAGLGRFEESEPLLLEGTRQLEERRGVGNIDTQRALARVVSMYEAWARPAQAEAYRRKLSIGPRD